MCGSILLKKCHTVACFEAIFKERWHLPPTPGVRFILASCPFISIWSEAEIKGKFRAPTACLYHEICISSICDMTATWRRHDGDMTAIWRRHDCDMTAIWRRYDGDMTWLRYDCDMTAIWLRYDGDMTEIWQRHDCDMTTPASAWNQTLIEGKCYKIWQIFLSPERVFSAHFRKITLNSVSVRG